MSSDKIDILGDQPFRPRQTRQGVLLVTGGVWELEQNGETQDDNKHLVIEQLDHLPWHW